LREMGIPESQIRTVVELARHVRDEADSRVDEDLNAALGIGTAAEEQEAAGGCCGSEPQPAKSGSCC
ncbi:MAG: hypothetical protein V5A50_14040, partial [Thiohalorhabdus sp.]